MGEKRFSFVSPGVKVNEIDNSGRPDIATSIGPIVIGRSERGPSVPTTVDSMAEFIEVFGNPIPGGKGGDIWRDGNKTAPSYATYAAQAWLRNNSPLTFVRLLGHEHENATSAGKAGWEVQSLDKTANAGGAYGLFVVDSGSIDDPAKSGSLAAIWYISTGSIALSGTVAGTSVLTSSTGCLIESTGPNKEFKVQIFDGSGVAVKTTAFNFNESSKKFIRKVFNTNPTLTNTDVTPASSVEKYWLGETFEKYVNLKVEGSAAGLNHGIIVGLKANGSTSSNARRRRAS